MTASNGIANIAPQSIRDAAAEIARFAYGSWSALPGDLAEGRLTRHYLLDVLTRATASAYESGLEDGRREGLEEAAKVADKSKRTHQRAIRDARKSGLGWSVCRQDQAMIVEAKAIAAAIRARITTPAEGRLTDLTAGRDKIAPSGDRP